ncbi:MAG: TonB-dependent receptor, partial [Thermoanaerobaculia bacterium]|nr:TonB-dependent receptor [Thermoanaerobaculia bacterium]
SDLSTDAVSQQSLPGYDEDDPFENTTYTGRLGIAVLDDGRLDLSYRSYEGDTELDGFGAEALNANQVTDGETVALTFEKNFTRNWRQTLRYGRGETDLLGDDPDFPSNRYDIRSENEMLEAQADVSIGASHLLNLGYTTEERIGRNVGAFGFDEEADLDSWFVQDQWSVGEHVNLTGAIRNDDHSVFGDETSYRVTGTGAFNRTQTRIYGSVGSAFRAPNFNELYFPFSGDPTLRPETSEGWDLGIHHHGPRNRWSVDLAWFDIEFDDLIDFDLATFTFKNVASAKSEGAELTLRYQPLDALDLVLSHTWNETEDESTGDPLARRPENRTTLVAQFLATDRLDGAVSAAAVSDRVDSTGLDMDDYVKMDLSLRFRAFSWLRPFARIENLLDEDYEEVPNFTTPGRTWYVGLTLARDPR